MADRGEHRRPYPGHSCSMSPTPDAAAFARDAHAGQVDKQGRGYFEAHLRPIAEATQATYRRTAGAA